MAFGGRSPPTKGLEPDSNEIPKKWDPENKRFQFKNLDSSGYILRVTFIKKYGFDPETRVVKNAKAVPEFWKDKVDYQEVIDGDNMGNNGENNDSPKGEKKKPTSATRQERRSSGTSRHSFDSQQRGSPVFRDKTESEIKALTEWGDWAMVQRDIYAGDKEMINYSVSSEAARMWQTSDAINEEIAEILNVNASGFDEHEDFYESFNEGNASKEELKRRLDSRLSSLKTEANQMREIHARVIDLLKHAIVKMQEEKFPSICPEDIPRLFKELCTLRRNIKLKYEVLCRCYKKQRGMDPRLSCDLCYVDDVLVLIYDQQKKSVQVLIKQFMHYVAESVVPFNIHRNRAALGNTVDSAPHSVTGSDSVRSLLGSSFNERMDRAHVDERSHDGGRNGRYTQNKRGKSRGRGRNLFREDFVSQDALDNLIKRAEACLNSKRAELTSIQMQLDSSQDKNGRRLNKGDLKRLNKMKDSKISVEKELAAWLRSRNLSQVPKITRILQNESPLPMPVRDHRRSQMAFDADILASNRSSGRYGRSSENLRDGYTTPRSRLHQEPLHESVNRSSNRLPNNLTADQTMAYQAAHERFHSEPIPTVNPNVDQEYGSYFRTFNEEGGASGVADGGYDDPRDDTNRRRDRRRRSRNNDDRNRGFFQDLPRNPPHRDTDRDGNGEQNYRRGGHRQNPDRGGGGGPPRRPDDDEDGYDYRRGGHRQNPDRGGGGGPPRRPDDDEDGYGNPNRRGDRRDRGRDRRRRDEDYNRRRRDDDGGDPSDPSDPSDDYNSPSDTDYDSEASFRSRARNRARNRSRNGENLAELMEGFDSEADMEMFYRNLPKPWDAVPSKTGKKTDILKNISMMLSAEDRFLGNQRNGSYFPWRAQVIQAIHKQPLAISVKIQHITRSVDISKGHHYLKGIFHSPAYTPAVYKRIIEALESYYGGSQRAFRHLRDQMLENKTKAMDIFDLDSVSLMKGKVEQFVEHAASEDITHMGGDSTILEFVLSNLFTERQVYEYRRDCLLFRIRNVNNLRSVSEWLRHRETMLIWARTNCNPKMITMHGAKPPAQGQRATAHQAMGGDILDEFYPSAGAAATDTRGKNRSTFLVNPIDPGNEENASERGEEESRPPGSVSIVPEYGERESNLGTGQDDLAWCLQTVGKPQSECSFCKSGNHLLWQCESFQNATPELRLNKVRNDKRCLNCLSPLHHWRECTSDYSCTVCKQRHHSLLHEYIVTAQKAKKAKNG